MSNQYIRVMSDRTIYPYSETDLRLAIKRGEFSPNGETIILKKNPTDADLQAFGMFPVQQSGQPEGDVLTPYAIYQNNQWIQHWDVRDFTPEEQAAHDKSTAEARKLEGVEFDGVMCSATAEDMWGLNSVKDWVASGQSVNFRFENGNVLTLTHENYAAFEAVWVPFRASFF